MKKLALAFVLFSTPAFAQQTSIPPKEIADMKATQQAPAPDTDAIVAQYLIETGQLRMQLGQTQQALTAARKEIADLKAELLNPDAPAANEPPQKP
jgi:hypothetical protein